MWIRVRVSVCTGVWCNLVVFKSVYLCLSPLSLHKCRVSFVSRCVGIWTMCEASYLWKSTNEDPRREPHWQQPRRHTHSLTHTRSRHIPTQKSNQSTHTRRHIGVDTHTQGYVERQAGIYFPWHLCIVVHQTQQTNVSIAQNVTRLGVPSFLCVVFRYSQTDSDWPRHVHGLWRIWDQILTDFG